MEEKYQNLWLNESYNYFKRNYGDVDLRTIKPNFNLQSLLKKTNLDLNNNKILEIGCGAGNNLYWLKNMFKADVYGIEVSPKLVNLLNKNFDEITFINCHSHDLPFKKNSFDLVILRSVLHWVDRDYIMQTVGEAIRVSNKYLIISDFAPLIPYSVEYKHQNGLKTYKIDYQNLVESSLQMKMIFCEYYKFEDEWNALKTALYKKVSIDDAYPEKDDLSI
ncbi:class I SAM-dependent methyltransferase [Methanobacterium formicicum]|uniref:Ubiquinone/menaquinone biosynthesis methylase-like protein n=1 Tax=Methanobacterium formicicum (strain DSM 3637 / PP1) TaxID=1204725 RepID=K2QDD8_METFP|nr:class I SAM-dependent methyltransferase [Methanobacterium formicicum]EKF86041.1 ubiquinone/menaquinone biosynthesis methylase-like protein [Methanobacterium formicicum DSM 3637]